MAEKLGEIAIKGVGGEGVASGKDVNKRRGNRARRNLENAGWEDKRSVEDKAEAERVESRTAGREEMAGAGAGLVDESWMGNEAETGEKVGGEVVAENITERDAEERCAGEWTGGGCGCEFGAKDEPNAVR